MLGIFVAPMVIVLKQSLTPDGDGPFSLDSFQSTISDPLLLKVGTTTLEITLLSTIIALLLAYPVAFYLAQQPPRRRGLLMVFLLVPFWTSVLVKSFAFTVILGHSGLVSTALAWAGLPAIGLSFNRVGVVVGMTHQCPTWCSRSSATSSGNRVNWRSPHRSWGRDGGVYSGASRCR